MFLVKRESEESETLLVSYKCCRKAAAINKKAACCFSFSRYSREWHSILGKLFGKFSGRLLSLGNGERWHCSSACAMRSSRSTRVSRCRSILSFASGSCESGWSSLQHWALPGSVNFLCLLDPGSRFVAAVAQSNVIDCPLGVGVECNGLHTQVKIWDCVPQGMHQ